MGEGIRTQMVYLDVLWKGCTVYCFDQSDGQIYYTILLNSKFSKEQLENTFKHEMDHILNGDFDSMVSADRIECVRHD